MIQVFTQVSVKVELYRYKNVDHLIYITEKLPTYPSLSQHFALSEN